MKRSTETTRHPHRRTFRRPSPCACDALRRALTAGELELHYQPIVDLTTDLVRGLEALVRWRHPEQGLLAAGSFVPTAEACGLIADIDAWVLDRAAAQIATWQDDVLIAPGFRVAVNLCGAEFGDEGLARRVVDCLRRHDADPECLTIELTETVDLSDLVAAHRAVRSLQQTGVHVALDDFGAAYATFRRLHVLPFDLVKLDRDVSITAGSPVGAAFMRAVVGLGDGLGMQVVAEGIETREQSALAAELGCHLAQGYLWSPAMPADEVTTLLESGHGFAQRAAN